MKIWTKPGAAHPPGTKQEIALEITEVNGDQFKGFFSFQWGPQPVKIKGRFTADAIEWTGDGARLETYTARVNGNHLSGKCGNGDVELELTDKL